MVNYSKATQLFAIGYVSAVGLAVILNPLQPLLRAMIIFGIIQLIFAELHFRHLRRLNCLPGHSLQVVLKVGVYWAFLSFALDILLFSVMIPVLSGTEVFSFLETQPVWYWLQFPMMLITGLVARITYVKINDIQSAAAKKEEIIAR